MPSLTSHKHFQDALRLPFCYLCGRQLIDDEDVDRDHLPPKSCFSARDRSIPLKLPTHRSCNGGHNLIDEQIGQLVSLKHGRVPPARNQKLAIGFWKLGEEKRTSAAITNLDIKGAIWRWIRGFHAALYREPISEEVRHAIQTPFPVAKLTRTGPELEAIRPQHPAFVEAIKINRAARNLDLIRANNRKMTYEAVWTQFDSGEWFCIFALDLYAWRDLGDVKNFTPRGCVGMYALSSGTMPATATPTTKLKVLIPNYERLDPFGR